MRQLFLGRGADDEVHKGMTGNTMVISQPSPSYDQVVPNNATLSDGLVVLRFLLGQPAQIKLEHLTRTTLQ